MSKIFQIYIGPDLISGENFWGETEREKGRHRERWRQIMRPKLHFHKRIFSEFSLLKFHGYIDTIACQIADIVIRASYLRR
jgi:hypothetical protein